MLDQKTADSLIRTRKFCLSDIIYDLNHKKLNIALRGADDPHDEFTLDIHRGFIRLDKHYIQGRARQSIGLVRLCIMSGCRHTNPDGSRIEGSHIHFYREGYDLKWAIPLPYSGMYGSFKFCDDLMLHLEQLYSILCIVKQPRFQGTLI